MKETILLVDDEQGIRTVMGLSLRDAGYNVITVASGEEALQLFAERPIPIVITDIRMPGMNGLDLLKHIKILAPETEVILISGHADLEMAIQGLKLEASDFITKPIDDDLLHISLKRALERIAMRNKLKEYTSNLEKMINEKSAQLVEAERQLAARQVVDGFAFGLHTLGSSLSGEQQAAYDALLSRYREGKPACALLHGITGSGKTQVYMNLIDQVLEDGRQVLVLVPEISLTPQMMRLFLEKYGRRVAVLHSALAIGERMDEWKRVKRGEARVVVGTRSAVFAPCDNLGLIVMDEEQEHTYKSESSPRYHARDVAKFRCARHGALLLLTSATPSVESYHAALTGRYSLHELHGRFGAAQLPEVEVVDMRQEEEGESVIGPTLRREMQNTLDKGRQVILLLNRRGFNTHISCRSCGYVVTCPSCSISMTYHRANGMLLCHYCGHMQPPVTICPECGSDKVRYAGLGTQRVEQELEQLFPGVPVLRMDTDTTMSRFAYEDKFSRFAKGEFRIMVGTQMVAKGLDFPLVGLVGVLSADQALYGDDFRCYETTFSLLTQVIGRAGRRDEAGKAVIQTYTPENYVIALAAQQDYRGFYELEIASRKMMKYPPYTDLCLIGFAGVQESQVRDAAGRFLADLQGLATREYADVPMIALDPTPAAVARAAGKYRYKLLIKTVNTARLRELVGRLLTEANRKPENKALTVYADINPAGML